MLQSVLVGGHEKDGRGSQHVGWCAGRRADAADTGWPDTGPHRLTQQGTTQSRLHISAPSLFNDFILSSFMTVVCV